MSPLARHSSRTSLPARRGRPLHVSASIQFIALALSGPAALRRRGLLQEIGEQVGFSFPELYGSQMFSEFLPDDWIVFDGIKQPTPSPYFAPGIAFAILTAFYALPPLALPLPLLRALLRLAHALLQFFPIHGTHPNFTWQMKWERARSA